jgi:hypothetical protein
MEKLLNTPEKIFMFVVDNLPNIYDTKQANEQAEMYYKAQQTHQKPKRVRFDLGYKQRIFSAQVLDNAHCIMPHDFKQLTTVFDAQSQAGFSHI